MQTLSLEVAARQVSELVLSSCKTNFDMEVGIASGQRQIKAAFVGPALTRQGRFYISPLYASLSTMLNGQYTERSIFASMRTSSMVMLLKPPMLNRQWRNGADKA